MSNPSSAYSINQHSLASLVGVVALGLPVILHVSTVFGICRFHSISHFYYAPWFGGLFVCALAFIGVFLIAYRAKRPLETNLASVAGLCAFGVALFPTEGPGCDDPIFVASGFVDVVGSTVGPYGSADPETLSDWFTLFPGVDYLHAGSAITLFAFLAWYCLFVFTRVEPERHRRGGGAASPLTGVKKVRNGFYYITGSVIVVSLLAIGAKIVGGSAFWPDWDRNTLTFWFESAALVAFGVSWLVHGRLFGTVLRDE